MMEIKIIHEIQDVRQPHQADVLTQLVPFMEKLVSQLDDLQTLNEGIGADLAAIKAHLINQNEKLGELTTRLEQLNQTTPPQVDLTPALGLAQHIKDEADAIVASFGHQDAPANEPADGGADVDGAVSADPSQLTAAGGGDEIPAGGEAAPVGEDNAAEPAGDAGAEQGADQNGPDTTTDAEPTA